MLRTVGSTYTAVAVSPQKDPNVIAQSETKYVVIVEFGDRQGLAVLKVFAGRSTYYMRRHGGTAIVGAAKHDDSIRLRPASVLCYGTAVLLAFTLKVPKEHRTAQVDTNLRNPSAGYSSAFAVQLLPGRLSPASLQRMAVMYQGYCDLLGRKKLRKIVIAPEHPASVFLLYKIAILRKTVRSRSRSQALKKLQRGDTIETALRTIPHYFVSGTNQTRSLQRICTL